MTGLGAWLKELPFWSGIVVLIGAGVFTAVLIEASSSVFRWIKNRRQRDHQEIETSSSKSSEPEEKKDELEKQLSIVSSEYKSYKKDTEYRQKKELGGLSGLITAEEERANLLKVECDSYRLLAKHHEVMSDDKEKELSDLRTKYSSLQEQHGKAVLWASGQECNQRELSIVVQHVETNDVDLARKIRTLLTYYLQGDRTVSRDKYEVQHILTPFTNPSSDARIVIFSDDEVGSNVKNAFNRYNLIDEKVARFEKSFTDGKFPDDDIAIVVFPERSSD